MNKLSRHSSQHATDPISGLWASWLSRNLLNILTSLTIAVTLIHLNILGTPTYQQATNRAQSAAYFSGHGTLN
ncbi:hypothetical protein CI610_03400 [invertebrate metagenome]|uniref:Uncharacterized protein n=1 Tax=invertebrate metagenome TaxID=1711999 RepID=A0A2H9T3A0_9ZZZZ